MVQQLTRETTPSPAQKPKPSADKVRFGLRFKFLVLVSLLLLLVVGSIAQFLVRSNANSLRQNLQSEASSFATLATTPIGDSFVTYKDSGTVHLDQQVSNFTQYSQVISNISIVDLGGKVLYSKNTASQPQITADEASTFKTMLIHNGRLGSLSRVIFPYFEGSSAHRYTLIYDISSQEIENAVRDETKVVLIFAGIALALTILAMYLVINTFILRPIHTVSKQASIISGGDLEQQVEAKGHDEISQLGRSVNAMANSLKDYIVKLKEVDKVKSEFMIITSHNLRTPLTVINGYTDAKEQFKTIDQYKNALEGISASAKRLNTLTEDILTISRFELGETKVFQEPVDLTQFIKSAAADFKVVCENQKRKFKVNIDSKPRITNISSAHIRSAVWNIFDNALKFTPENGEVSISLEDDGQSAIIKISDTGIGISTEELPKLFTKFHRGTSIMRYDYEGTGIGLYASKLIIDHHNGTIEAASTEGKGSTFTINLPLAKEGDIVNSRPKPGAGIGISPPKTKPDAPKEIGEEKPSQDSDNKPKPSDDEPKKSPTQIKLDDKS